MNEDEDRAVTQARERSSGARTLPAGRTHARQSFASRRLDVGRDRYAVLEEIGRGGMGRVLRAYDPKLQREVALKELHAEGLGQESMQRLVIEARAMAKLAHPNVVSVFDVEELDGGRLRLVMEYVPGQTLRQWLEREPRSWRDIIEHCVAAGRGLAAAHAAGVLHRDFKPDNALIEERGPSGAASKPPPVKVTDFGLAKAPPGTTSTLSASAELERWQGAPSNVTAVGMVVGTPRYMAPEQHRPPEDLVSLTPASDQYAFCVTVWEALCGAPPFLSAPGQGSLLLARKLEGPPAWPPGAARSRPSRDSIVPHAIVLALRRGLSPDPEDRWPDMETLLDALDVDPRRQRRQMMLTLGGVTTIALLGAVLYVESDRRAEKCTGARAKLGQAWDETRRQGVHAAIEGVDAPYAADVWKSVSSELDAYVEQWAEHYATSCKATLFGAQSPQVMDLRMSCLERARRELVATTEVLADADADVVAKAHDLLAGLRPLARCDDIESLRRAVEPPLPTDAAVVEEIREYLAAYEAASRAARLEQASASLERADALLSRTDYQPVRTELALARAGLLFDRGKFQDSAQELQRVLLLAGRWRQREELALSASHLLFAVGYMQQRPDEAMAYLQLARGLADADPWHRAQTENSYAAVLKAQGKYPEAEAAHRRALAHLETMEEPPRATVALFTGNLANLLSDQGKYDEADQVHRRAVALSEEAFGPSHPSVGMTRTNLGTTLQAQGKVDEAEQQIRRGLQIRLAALGPEHPTVAQSRVNLGTVLSLKGDVAGAEEQFRKALELREAQLPPNHPQLASARANLASILEAQGRYEEAEESFRQAGAMLERSLGSEHPNLGLVHNNLSVVLEVQGRHEAAQREAERALRIWTNSLDEGHPWMGLALTNLGLALDGQGRYEAAEREHRRALRVQLEALGPEHADVARSRLNLGIALAKQERPDEAMPLLRQALVELEAALGDDHNHVALARVRLAEVLLGRNGAAEALELAERAWARHQRDGTPPARRADTSFVLARALWKSADDPARRRARALARRALRDAEQAIQTSSADANDVAEIRRWLRTHPDPTR